MAKKMNSTVTTSLLYIALGALLVIFRSGTLQWAMTLAGIVFVVAGVLDLTKKNYVSGLASVIIGVVVLVLGWTAVDIVLLVLGVLLAIKGLVAFADALRRKKNNFLDLLLAVAMVVAGVLLATGNALDIIIVVVGVILIVDGVLGLFGSRRR